MCAFFSSSKKYIRKGDNAMERGDYTQAIEYYQKAGPDAKDKLINAWMPRYGNIFAKNPEKTKVNAQTVLLPSAQKKL